MDELYNARARVVLTAAARPAELFAGTVAEEPAIDLEGIQSETAVEGVP